MSKEAVFTMKIEADLREEFMAEATAAHRPASQILRELMRDYVQSQRDAREYNEFLRDKVETGRASMRAIQGRSNEEVEAKLAARRNSVTSVCELFGRQRRSKIAMRYGTIFQPKIQ